MSRIWEVKSFAHCGNRGKVTWPIPRKRFSAKSRNLARFLSFGQTDVQRCRVSTTSVASLRLCLPFRQIMLQLTFER